LSFLQTRNRHSTPMLLENVAINFPDIRTLLKENAQRLPGFA
jgi:hypothetical protein